jgi:hypothetical protein
MTIWQDLMALGLVAFAAAYLTVRLRRAGSRKAPHTCGTCSGCTDPAAEVPLVKLQPPHREP